MKILAFNGSPRKEWNTATLLNKALEGAASQGATTELIHLYGLEYKGCTSCFACKIKGGKSYGKCPIPDDLLEVFKKVEEADGLIFGSPIYWGRVSGEMAAFLDRLLFQYLEYSNSGHSLFQKKVKSGFIYTMNVTEEWFKKAGLDKHVEFNEFSTRMIFGDSESLLSFDTVQFEDYSKVVATSHDVEGKIRRRAEVFPIDCQKAFEMGVRLATDPQ
ncbi:flavodoxin family protein [Methanospirillum lacunae]|uniref:Flavodoxin n=1 Tax=Methanospirillum lacunae TaxID=668570 RepID=A0A2V2MP64_9EURY|nr:flavodoxin family protein [Methanospirillum lacunae]PWR70014.1 flavodoxin [Methanospirillum lacunae]